ncbi:MAG: lipid IV(A) 3-deoxy-D-manno-octulosonic acid transferase [Povalibacter sp.]
MSRLIYTLLIYAAAPIAFLNTVWRGLRDPAFRDRWAERFGFVEAPVAGASIWIHAVSVGEVQAAAVLIRALRQRRPDSYIVVTTATPTGASRVKALFPTGVQHVYLPYDLPGAVRRFLRRIAPHIAIVMETEIWPNLYRECFRADVPIVLASARLSEKSVRRMSLFTSVFKQALHQNVSIAAQSARDAERFRSLGVPAERVQETGNIKFDIEVAPQLKEQGRTLRTTHFPRSFVWVAGSTHEGEESLVLDAHRMLMAEIPDAMLILVPRHPQRFESVRQWLSAQNVSYVARSRGELPNSSTRILLGDTLGELMMFYAAADVAFVGGSFVTIGGHNLLEPAALGIPVLTGPHNFNAPDIAARLFESGAALELTSAAELSRTLISLAREPERRAQMGRAALDAIQRNRGALERVLAIVNRQLTSSAENTARN